MNAVEFRRETAAGSRGFTVLELMIAVAIVAILGSVALPAYNDYVRRGLLPEAFSSLADFRVKMEQYYQDNRRYGTSTCADAVPAPSWAGFAPNGVRAFTFACELLSSGQGFRVTATGRSGTAAVGHIYTIDHANAQATTQFKGSSVSKTCWLSKGGEC